MRLSIGMLEKLLQEYMEAKKFSKKSVRAYQDTFKMFSKYLTRINKDSDLRDFSRDDMKKFIDYLCRYKKKNGDYLKNESKRSFFFCVRCFIRYLYQMEYLLYNPVDGIELKIKEDSLARRIMTVEEMERFLSGIASSDAATQARDKALFETMYITGMRSSEIRSLKISDIDFDRDQILIRDGKGSKDRIVPIGTLSKKYLYEYISKFRKKFLQGSKDNGFLFTSRRSKKKMNSNNLIRQFKRYAEIAGLNKDLTPHCIRHSASTHLLDGGAGIKYVKTFLGHKNIETTVTYTHFMIDSIKKIFRKYHPRDNNLYEEVPPDLETKVMEMMKHYQKKVSIY